MKAKFTVFRSIFSVNKSVKSRADIVVKVEETIRDEEIFKAPLPAKIVPGKSVKHLAVYYLLLSN